MSLFSNSFFTDFLESINIEWLICRSTCMSAYIYIRYLKSNTWHIKQFQSTIFARREKWKRMNKKKLFLLCWYCKTQINFFSFLSSHSLLSCFKKKLLKLFLCVNREFFLPTRCMQFLFHFSDFPQYQPCSRNSLS